jgi:hypothetical protein
MKDSYEKKLKQHTIDTEKITLLNIEKSLEEQEVYLKQKFQKIKEQYLANFQKRKKQLMMSYNDKFQNKLNYTKKKHNENYKNTKLSLDNFYKNELNLMKLDLENKSKKKTIISEIPNFENDEVKAKETQYLEKLKKLEQKEQQIEFFKTEIKSVLSDFVQLVNLKERQTVNVNYGIDENKMFQKYLGPITEDDFKQLNQYEDEEIITIYPR